MSRTQSHRRIVLAASFLIPMVLMGAYFAYRGMAPFGTASILTVDLGQQYVDFFAYLRASLLHHPASFLYSFSKGLGGEMWGTNAYYLLSPLNLILLAFPGKWLTSGILLILLLKYGLAGLSMAWLLDRAGLQTGPRLLAFSTPYALMGWMVANQLNLLWLDVLFLLPLVVWGLIKLYSGHGGRFYLLALAATMVDNYYMAWMVALFTALFSAWWLSDHQQSWRTRARRLTAWIGHSLGAAALSAVVLLPTIAALLTSKGTYTATKWSLKWEYNPLRILAKFVPGSFNFDQMPSGQPNFYVGMLMVAGTMVYFFHRRDRLAARLVAAGITILLMLSAVWPPLDLIWHLGQFPVWYPARFSYLISFWLIWLAARGLQPVWHLSWPGAAFLALPFAIGGGLLLSHRIKGIGYVTTPEIWLGLGFALVTILVLTCRRSNAPRLTDTLWVLLATCDVACAAFTCLNQLSYVTQPQFANYTVALDRAVAKVKARDHGDYRVAKDFMRTKDDPFQADYAAADHFGSTMEPAVANFMSAIGQPAGDGFVTYADGTLVTDSLLGFKYAMVAHPGSRSGHQPTLPPTSRRFDWGQQPVRATTSAVSISQNRWALPLAFGASPAIQKLKATTQDPLSYQSAIYQALAGQSAAVPLFTVENFDHVTFANLNQTDQITGSLLNRRQPLAPASMTLTFTPTSNDPYYLTLGAGVLDDVAITRDGQPLNQYPTYRDTVVASVADHSKGRPITLTFTMKKPSAWLQNVSLYRLNRAAFERDARRLQRAPLKLTGHGANWLAGTVNLPKGQTLLMTTIPAAPGWHAKVDGHPAKLTKVVNTFWAVKMTPGHHRVQLTFVPPLLLAGLTISLLTAVVLIGSYWFPRRRN